MNIHTLFSRTLAQCSDNAWLHANDFNYSGTEVERESIRHAAWLVSLGLAPGDRVMAQVQDSPQALFLHLGALRAGCIFVPLPTAWPAADMDWFMRDAEPRLIVCGTPMQAAIAELARRMDRPAQVFSLDGAGGTLMAALPPSGTSSAIAERGEEDVALVLYSAGTTGPARGARLTHGMLAANATSLSTLWNLDTGDTIIAALPLFSIHGLCAALHPALCSGAQLRLHSDATALPADFARATVLVAEPQTYQSLLSASSWSRETCKPMRLFISAGAHLPPATALSFGERSGHVPRQCYGSSATGIITTHAAEGEFRIDSAGKPLPGTRLRIVGANLKPMPLEHQGEIQLPGFDGWWNPKYGENDGRTTDGWFRTGDIGMWDENGYIIVVGCAADVIASGYYKIYPEDVEHALLELPGIAEAAVIGLPHAELGQVTTAFIVRSGGSRIGEGEVRAALQSRLAHYQIPAEIRFLPALPRNALGKLQKMRLREQQAAGTH